MRFRRTNPRQTKPLLNFRAPGYRSHCHNCKIAQRTSWQMTLSLQAAQALNLPLPRPSTSSIQVPYLFPSWQSAHGCWGVSSCRSPHPLPQVDPAYFCAALWQEQSQSSHDKCGGKTQICCLGEDKKKLTLPAGITGAWQQCMEGDKGRNGGAWDGDDCQPGFCGGGGSREVEAHTCCQEGIRWKSRSGKESTCVPPPCLQPFQSSSVHRQALSLWQSHWDTNHVEAQPNSRDRKAALCHALFYSLASGYVLSPMNSLLFFPCELPKHKFRGFPTYRAKGFGPVFSALARTSVLVMPSFKLVEIYNLAFVDKLALWLLK